MLARDAAGPRRVRKAGGMTADMKTLREGLRRLMWPSLLGPDPHDALSAALDELEALRGQASYVASLDTENQRLRAEAAEAQRDELLAALEKVTFLFRPETVRSGCCEDCDATLQADAAIANARGDR